MISRAIGLPLLLASALLASPFPATAQPKTLLRIGILSTANPRSIPIYQAFEQRLRDLGYVEGQNLAIDFRNAEGQVDQLPSLAHELVRLTGAARDRHACGRRFP